MTDILAGLDDDTKDVNIYYDRIEQAAADGRGAELVEAGLSIADRQRNSFPFGTVHDHIVTTLALTPVPGNALAAATLSDRPRRLASLLAFAQPPELLAGLGAPVLEACLAHELVLRGKEVTVTVPADHPLAALPLRLLDVESGIQLPTYHRRGSTGSLPFGPYERDDAAADGVAAAVTRIADRPLTTAAVQNWHRDSNGVVEAAMFATAAEAVTPALLRSLPMAAFEGAGAGDVIVRPAGAAEVYAVLFGAASGGSAYGHGEYGAFGRLHAWESMSAMCGTDSLGDLPPATYALFSAETDWYHQVAWDLGVAVLSDGVLGVLAATDTD